MQAAQAIPREAPPEQTGAALTQQELEAYLEDMRARGFTESSLQKYRRDLTSLYEYLPPGKAIRPGTLERWQDALLSQGYAPRTVNARTSVANSFLDWLGHRELQLPRFLCLGGDVQPELTRTEYLRLLSVAKALGREQTYFLIKTFAATGVGVQELPELTVEAVSAGRMVTRSNGLRQLVHLPPVLQKELAEYIGRRRLTSGPVFLNSSGKAIRRSVVTASIQRLAQDTRVAPEKCNPRCLRKLYQRTMAGIEANVALLVEQSHQRLLEQEQLSIGWEEDGS